MTTHLDVSQSSHVVVLACGMYVQDAIANNDSAYTFAQMSTFSSKVNCQGCLGHEFFNKEVSNVHKFSEQEKQFIQALRWTLTSSDVSKVLFRYFDHHDNPIVARHARTITNSIVNQWIINGNSMTEVYFED